MNLSGKATIVTGGAGGIGYAIAERFTTEGAKVMIADVDEARRNVEDDPRHDEPRRHEVREADDALEEAFDVHWSPCSQWNRSRRSAGLRFGVLFGRVYKTETTSFTVRLSRNNAKANAYFTFKRLRLRKSAFMNQRHKVSLAESSKTGRLIPFAR